MEFKKYIFLLFLIYPYIPSLAQVDTAWVRRYNGPADSTDIANALAVDDSGNVYVTGVIDITCCYDFPYLCCWGDYGTIKYAPSGDILWVRRYNGPYNSYDYASALAVDDSGNVYVTGSSLGSGAYNDYDYTTIKYASNGDTLWVRRYVGPENSGDYPSALAVDGNGNVYVTGSSYGSGFSNPDYATIKYSPNGDTLWVRRYNGPGNDYDYGYALAVDNSGNVYVTGGSEGIENSWLDYATVKYAPNGDTSWVRRYSGSVYGYDAAHVLAVDNNGNVYVTGNSLFDYATIKYSPNGDTLWVRRYHGPANRYDHVKALAVDDSGNVYVTGVIDIDCYDYPYICYGGDYATIKYAPNGDTLWVRRYNGPGNGPDSALALAVDGSGNLYVTGSSNGSGTSADYTTIKYAPNGDTLWVRRYNGTGNGDDVANALAVDGSGNVYVSGYSWSGTSYDYVTIKYNKLGCAARTGDAQGDIEVNLADVIFEVNYIFMGDSPPDPFCAGDANADGNVLLPDIVYLINFLYKSGPAPIKSRECCL